jgi:dolichol kinase
MFIRALIATLCVIVFILICQRLIDKYSKDNESMRKFVHVLHGVGIAGLALFAPYSLIIAIEVFFLMSMFVARYLYENFSGLPWVRYLGRTYSVGRVSYGDFLFPMSTIIIISLAESRGILAASVLILGLADAAAALIGKRYGASSTYKIFGQNKSMVGSMAFFVVALAIAFVFSVFVQNTGEGDIFLAILGVALATTIAENLGVYGSDNLLIPIVATLALNQL